MPVESLPNYCAAPDAAVGQVRHDGLAGTGPVVCACFGVGRSTICDAIAAGAATTAEIGARLKAGTNCGSCIPEMKRLIAQADATADESQKLAAAAS